MITKIKAIWRVITNKFYVVISEDGITATLPEDNTSNYMRTIVEGFLKIINNKE